MSRGRGDVPSRLVLTLALGTILNPLNSSMIAIALVSLQRDFSVSIATSTWAASVFYVAAVVGQPLMGRLADQLGARRLFIAGLALTGVVSALAPLAPSFGWLLVARAAQAISTSVTFPCAHILIRSAAPATSTGPPRAALATISVAASASAALGPVLGGVLIAVAGWEAIFLVNVPITAAGIILGLRFLPRVGPASGHRLSLRDLDIPGIVLFAAALTTTIFFVLSLVEHPVWWLLPVTVGSFCLLVWRELVIAEPFLDVRGIITNRALATVLIQQISINLVFYCMFFGLPMWLEHVRGFTPDVVGLLVLPTTLVGILVVPLTARAVRRRDPALLMAGAALILVVASAAIQLLDDATPVLLILTITFLLGIPNGITNFGLQTMLYAAAPAERAGSLAGLYQAFRYMGAISATSVLGVLFERDLTSRGIHDVGYVMAGVAAALLVLTVVYTRSRRQR